ncbi:MAG: hypothetical protein LBD55_12285 [Treponema sp.]|jgi:hypothetical protein|nr:hypothetical protein [Treponema sp.]
MKAAPLLIISALLVSCASAGRVSAPPPGALEYRQAQEEQRQRQTELAIIGEKIETESRGVAEAISVLEISLAAPDVDREALALQAREARTRAERIEGYAESLNLQLARERETARLVGAMIDEREYAWQQAAAGKDTEIAALRADNQKATGQRNTLLAVVITAAVIIIAFIVVKVLRALKIIPF